MNEIKSFIEEDWNWFPEVKEICLAILHYKDKSGLLKLNDLQIISGGCSKSALVRAVVYLCGDRCNVLKIIYSTPEGTPIDSQLAKDALNGAKLFHPKTGKEIKDPVEQLCIRWVYQNY